GLADVAAVPVVGYGHVRRAGVGALIARTVDGARVPVAAIGVGDAAVVRDTALVVHAGGAHGAPRTVGDQVAATRDAVVLAAEHRIAGVRGRARVGVGAVERRPREARSVAARLAPVAHVTVGARKPVPRCRIALAPVVWRRAAA